MFKVAIVEDDQKAKDSLVSYLKKYAQEKDQLFAIDQFDNGQTFINHLEFEKVNYDILFLDIELPGLNGIEVAKRFREIDDFAILIFTTVMRQYAISGYMVNALDYMVKPIDYFNLSLKLDKAISLLDNKLSIISLKVSGGDLVRFKSKDVYYIESSNHLCVFHTEIGDFEQYNTMNNLEKEYRKYGFLRCSSSYIINPIHIDKIAGNTVYIRNVALAIGRSKKKAFLNEVWKYI